MPLVANTDLPSFQRLQSEGSLVIARDTAETREVRELHIGLLNMMPDKALEATERQFFRLVGESNQIARFYVHPFTLKELQRNAEGRKHVEKYYKSFEQVQSDGLDALIITGANVVDPALGQAGVLEPVDRSSQLGIRQCHVNIVFLPGHPCAAAVPLQAETHSTVRQVLGRFFTPGPGPFASPCGRR